jgi:hypothetical protein
VIDPLVVTIVFPATAGVDEKTVVFDTSLTGKVTAPQRGEEPVTTALNETQYTSGAVEWKEADDGELGDTTFEPSTAYKAIVTLTPTEDYTFEGFSGSFTYSDAAVTGAAGSSTGTWTVTIVFAATEAAPVSRTPTVAQSSDAIATKVTPADESVSFILNNQPAYTDGLDWALYDGEDTPIDDVEVSNEGNTLTMSKMEGVPPGTYKAAVTETTPKYATESAPITLTVRDPTSATPAAGTTTVPKDPTHPDYLEFTLTSNTYAGTPTWRVYNASTDGQEVDDVSIEVTGTTLKLSHNTYLKPGDYYVSVQEEDKLESDRLHLIVASGNTPSAAPTVSDSDNTVARSGSTAVFTLTGNSYTVSEPDWPRWKVYNALEYGQEVDGVTIVVEATTLTLTRTNGGKIAAGHYYVTVQELDALESPRLDLIVVPADPSRTPAFSSTVVQKNSVTQKSVEFTLSNDPEYSAESAWLVYAAQTDETPLAEVSADSTSTTLTLTASGDNLAGGVYWVEVTEDGKDESLRTAVTVQEWHLVTVTFEQPGDATIDFTIDPNGTQLSWADNTTLQVMGPAELGQKWWYLDGKLVSTAMIYYTLSAQQLALGTHTLTYQYLTSNFSDALMYSKTVIFEVVAESLGE